MGLEKNRFHLARGKCSGQGQGVRVTRGGDIDSVGGRPIPKAVLVVACS